MNSFVDKLIESKSICTINNYRIIFTDQVESQKVKLVWDGHSNNCPISITPDELEILYEHGLTKNVIRREDGTLHAENLLLIFSFFKGAIVCGILAPTTKKNMRPEIINYARKMGYISDEMTPVKMLTGTKFLISNSDGSYNIFFKCDNVFNINLLTKFTQNFFRNNDVEIKEDGILLKNLSESDVFSKDSIDMIRMYDIQLFYLNPNFDKKLLLRAILERKYIDQSSYIFSEGFSPKEVTIEIPEDKKESLTFNKFEKCKMNSGTLHHYGNSTYDMYTYIINVPYSEYIREVMINKEKISKHKYSKNNISVSFIRFQEKFQIISYDKDSYLHSNIMREFITLDYVITFLQNEKIFDKVLFYNYIISLLETDSSGLLGNEYYSYLKILKQALK